jgi:hypothetical protein
MESNEKTLRQEKSKLEKKLELSLKPNKKGHGSSNRGIIPSKGFSGDADSIDPKFKNYMCPLRYKI